MSEPSQARMAALWTCRKEIDALRAERDRAAEALKRSSELLVLVAYHLRNLPATTELADVRLAERCEAQVKAIRDEDSA